MLKFASAMLTQAGTQSLNPQADVTLVDEYAKSADLVGSHQHVLDLSLKRGVVKTRKSTDPALRFSFQREVVERGAASHSASAR